MIKYILDKLYQIFLVRKITDISQNFAKLKKKEKNNEKLPAP